jgi:hypothetical protein
VCYEHKKIAQPKGCEKDEETEKQQCQCGVCDDNHVEFDDGEERERVCCPCTTCNYAPIWSKSVWENPKVKSLVAETDIRIVEAGKVIEKMGKDLEEVSSRKFYHNQEHEAYENNWESDS